MNRHERRRLAAKGQGKRKIWLALPCYGGSVTVLTMKSIIHDMFGLIQRGDTVKVYDELGHADIYQLRAQIVASALSDPDMTDLVMIDNDVGWPAGGLQRLLDHDVDLVAGAYPKRDYPITFMYRSAEGPLMGDPGTGLIEVWGMPGGFMKMSRSMLEKMAAHYGPELTVLDSMVPSGKTVRLFDPYWWTDADGNKRVLAEDYAFCQRWRDIGGKVFMDVAIPMAHVGTHAFKGQLGQWLGDKMKKEEQAA